LEVTCPGHLRLQKRAAVGELQSPKPSFVSGLVSDLEVTCPGHMRLQKHHDVPHHEQSKEQIFQKCDWQQHLKFPKFGMSKPFAGVGQLDRVLDEAFCTWRFDALTFAEQHSLSPLVALVENILDRSAIVDGLGFERRQLSRFLVEIEQGYDLRQGNPFHNAVHAASVVHAVHAMLELGGVSQLAGNSLAVSAQVPGKEGLLERAACILAAAIHDFEHLGVNNDFLVKVGAERAIRYNDQHVNEHHHVAAAFAVLRREECSFHSHMPLEAFRWLRGLLIELVLSTDMADHGQYVKSLTESLPGAGYHSLAGRAMKTTTEAEHDSNSRRTSAIAFARPLLCVVIKSADLGHVAMPWAEHRQWVALLELEFFGQGDQEKALGLPVSFLMDREKPSVSASQAGFYDFVVMPMLKGLAAAAPSTGPVLEGAMANHREWLALESAAHPEALQPQDVQRTDSGSTESRRRSGRARQRLARWRAAVRLRTPSPGSPSGLPP